ncbi:tetratricopeptide repeat protein [Flavobacterium plurextorum]|nr:hypothetical protein [Flavobacterium plurextorum]
MKRTLFLSIFFFTSFTFAQINISDLSGKWIKYKIEMKDGSKLFDRFTKDSTFLEYTINRNTLCLNSNPIHKTNQSCLDFKLRNNELITSQYSKYVIERLSNDTLVMYQHIENLSDDKIKRFFFVKDEILLSKYQQKNINKKNIIASKEFTPKTSSTIELDLNKAFKNNYSNFRIAGNLTIFPKKRKIKTIINYSTKADSIRIKIIKTVIDNSIDKWNLKNFEEYDSVQLPFILDSEITKRYWGIKVIFFTNDIHEFEIAYGDNLENNRKSVDFFNKALKAYEKKDFLYAIQCFSESYKLDPKNLDALYNKATVYFESGDQNNACKTWKEISDLGQVNGKQLYSNNCNLN